MKRNLCIRKRELYIRQIVLYTLKRDLNTLHDKLVVLSRCIHESAKETHDPQKRPMIHKRDGNIYQKDQYLRKRVLNIAVQLKRDLYVQLKKKAMFQQTSQNRPVYP